jgi:hypothetical protein
MFYRLFVTKRPSQQVSFFSQTSEGATLLAAIPTATSDDGCLGIKRVSDGVTVINIAKWTDQASHDAFTAANQAAVDAAEAARVSYNTGASITHVLTTFESADVLF